MARDAGPIDAAIEAAVRDSFSRQGLMTALGARLAAIEAGRVVIELPYTAGVSQQHGLFHGGVMGAIADNAGGYAALSLMPAGSEVLTIEYKINFMRPARGALLRATGSVVRAGKSITVVRSEVETLDGAAVSHCALMQATMIKA
jgi:uncharacterized protein (TIGR00369 family)